MTGRGVLFATCCGMALSLPLAAQGRGGGIGGRESWIGIGASWSAPSEFNPQRCGSDVSATLGTGMFRALMPRVSWGLRGDLVYGNPFKREKCFFETVSAPQPTGPSEVTRVEATHSVPQYTFIDVSGVFAIDPVDTRWLRVRLYGGAAAVAFKPVLPLFGGVEVFPRVGGHRIAISVERWDWRLRLDSVQYVFQNGVLRNRIATGFDDTRYPVYVRISSVSGFGGRGPR